ncbi:hypothetical protein B5P46_24645 [Rhizobium leguminosarum]|uniref:Uncharacterized protein n=1 Tax=Rhizobium leguminosarum TaxID=384 RepID=A0A4Q1TLU3_RHILE|nr:hypothetical protein B5P46_24645 [Rhizobium leguminosarum]
MMVRGPKAKPVHPITPKRMEGIIHTHSIPCVCLHACQPAEGIFKRSTKNLRQATARPSNGAFSISFQMMCIRQDRRG